MARKSVWRRIQYWRFQMKGRKAAKFIRKIDRLMIKMNYSRQQRRAYWRDFTKSSRLRNVFANVFDKAGKSQ